MKEKFRDIRLNADNKLRLKTINSIIAEYQAQGYTLTLRQLYYQLVSRDVIPNKVTEYAKLSKLLTEGRMAGIVDWEAIEDRLRTPSVPASWDSPAEIMDTVIRQYKQPRMHGQEKYLEVWVEKDALSGVLKRVTEKYHVPILVNRGYSSVSCMYDSYERFKAALENNQSIELLYLGDFDPSGLDMIRDISERPLEMLLADTRFIMDAFDTWVQSEHNGDDEDATNQLRDEFQDLDLHKDCFIKEDDQYWFDAQKAFIKSRFTVTPIALTRAQITQYNPPPNPAKKTDPRSRKFIKEHGASSWEVDALRPEVLNRLLEGAIKKRVDIDKYNAILTEEIKGRGQLATLKGLLLDGSVEASEDIPDDEE